MFKALLILFLAAFSMKNASSQKRNNVWAFGDSVGLNFNTNPVSLFKSRSKGKKPPYFISSICDQDGKLMFYTDGITVWNGNNFPMRVYKDYWPWFDNVMPLVTPYVDNDSLYYIFGVEAQPEFGPNPNSNKLIYFTTKMYKAGDLDEVVYPRPSNRLFTTLLLDDASGVVAGTDHCNQVDRWIVGHSPGAFYSFLITKAGVNPVPVVTSVPSSVLPVSKLNMKYSNLKFSANSERMALPDNSNNKIVVFDFENQNGKFSNPMVIPIADDEILEDVELSPDGNKLYYGSYIVVEPETALESHFIYELDLNAGSVADIQKTLYRVNRNGDRVACGHTCYILNRTMQLGPDGRIYVNRREGDFGFDKTIGVIEDPSAYGKDINYYGSKFDLKRQVKYINYNYVRSSSFTPKENSIQYKKNTCADQPVSFSPIFNRLDSIKWNFGEPSSGSSNFSTLKTPVHTYPGPGTYIATAIIYNRCFVDTATAPVVIDEEKSVHVPSSIHDTVLCAGEKLEFDATAPYGKDYYWDDGYLTPKHEITKSGSYTINIYNDCSYDRKTINVTFNICPCNSFIPNAFSPNSDGLNDIFRPVFDCTPGDYKFIVFDRYGGKVFQSNILNSGWDGRKNGEPFPPGVYIWTLTYRNPGTKDVINKKGFVTLLR